MSEKKELTEKELSEKMQEILKKTLTEDEMQMYNMLGESLGVMHGLLYALEEEGILKSLGEEGILRIKSSMAIITDFTQKGLENEITKEKADKVRKDIIDSKLI